MTPTAALGTSTIEQAVAASRHIESQLAIPAEVLVAQWALESGWGQSSPGNNCFGIKKYHGCYGTQLIKTTEWFTDLEYRRFLSLGEGRTAILSPLITPNKNGRRLYHCQDVFATFPTIVACFQKRSELFQSPRYSALLVDYLTTHNLETFIRKMSAIYATAPNYADVLLSLIRRDRVQLALLTGPAPETAA